MTPPKRPTTRSSEQRLARRGQKQRRTTTRFLRTRTRPRNERLARVLVSLARRDDLDEEALDAWVRGVILDATFPEKPTPESLRLMANARHLLTSLAAEISLDERPSDGLDFLRPLVREALKKMF